MLGRYAFLLCGILLVEQNALAADPTSSTASQTSPTAAELALVPAVNGSVSGRNIIGAAVQDSRDNQIGEVHDLIIDGNNRVTDAVIALGGPLDFDPRLVRVSYTDLTIAGDHVLIAPSLQQQLSARPTFAYPEGQDIRIFGAVETPPADQTMPTADEMKQFANRVERQMQDWGERVDTFVGKVQRQGNEAARQASQDVANRWSEVEKHWQTLKVATKRAGAKPRRDSTRHGRTSRTLGRSKATVRVEQVRACGRDELHLFVDRKALAATKRLSLPDTAESLATCVGREEVPRRIPALIRTDLADDYADSESHAGKETVA